MRALVADRAFSRFHGVTWEAVAKSKQIDSLEDPVRLSDALCSVQACSRQQARRYHVRPAAAGVVICMERPARQVEVVVGQRGFLPLHSSKRLLTSASFLPLAAPSCQISGGAVDKRTYYGVYGDMLKALDGQDSLPDTFVDFFFERSSGIEGARPYSGMRIRDRDQVLG